MDIKIRYYQRFTDLGILLISLLLFYSCNTEVETENKRPNIVVILADDLGYSDIGSYGSEIKTPNLDRLAENGLRYTQFYNTARCCPTRASLLTGLYAHQTGLGWMTKVDMRTEGYTGEISKKCVTMGEVLQGSGYSTYMSGKWHVNFDDHTLPEGPQDNWPLQRGFDKFFGILKGASDYFVPDNLYDGNTHITPSEDFYFTDAVNDTSSKYIEEHLANKDNPFFLYVAHIAPHWPLHAKEEDVKKYEGTYLGGWEKLREERYERMKKLGVIDANTKLSEKTPGIPDWDSLTPEQQKNMDRRMAVYAGQIDCMDQGIGRIVETLKKHNELDNTIIIFLADNGGCMQPISRGESKLTEDIGSQKSFESYGEAWANVSNTPFRIYKKWAHEGGIASPFIVHWPAGIMGKNELRNQVTHVIDLMPTFLDVGDSEYPKQYKGNEIIPFEGISLTGSFKDEKVSERPLFWEHIANRGIREKDWKLVAFGHNKPPYTKEWELYNLKEDRSETKNLAKDYPQKVEELSAKWDKWAERTHALPINGSGWYNRINDFAKKTEN
jgi:arylsulfatase A-like enzyme